MALKKLVTLSLDQTTLVLLEEMAEEEAEGNRSLMVRLLVRHAQSARVRNAHPARVSTRGSFAPIEVAGRKRGRTSLPQEGQEG